MYSLQYSVVLITFAAILSIRIDSLKVIKSFDEVCGTAAVTQIDGRRCRGPYDPELHEGKGRSPKGLQGNRPEVQGRDADANVGEGGHDQARPRVEARREGVAG